MYIDAGQYDVDTVFWDAVRWLCCAVSCYAFCLARLCCAVLGMLLL